MNASKACALLLALGFPATPGQDEMPPTVNPSDQLHVEIHGLPKMQTIVGYYFVPADGCLTLETVGRSFGADGLPETHNYGSLKVAGQTCEQIQVAIRKMLTKQVALQESLTVRVELIAPPKVYRVIFDGGMYGQVVYKFPLTGNETVRDALAQFKDLEVSPTANVWLARVKERGVDRNAIGKDGRIKMEYRLEPEDRVYIGN